MFRKKKEKQSDGIKYADFQRRNFAVVVDLALALLFIMVFSPDAQYPSQITEIISQQERGLINDDEAAVRLSQFLFREGGVARIIAIFFTNTVVAGIIVVLFWVYCSSTPGKMLLGMKIVDSKTMEKPGILQFIVRYYIGYVISVVPLGLGFLWVNFNKRRRGWHDYISGTVVIVEPERDFSEYLKKWAKKFFMKQKDLIKDNFKDKKDKKNKVDKK